MDGIPTKQDQKSVGHWYHNFEPNLYINQMLHVFRHPKASVHGTTGGFLEVKAWHPDARVVEHGRLILHVGGAWVDYIYDG